jgi:hypothetical protein
MNATGTGRRFTASLRVRVGGQEKHAKKDEK